MKSSLSEEMIRDFIEAHEIKTLNVAGSRESKDLGIHQGVFSVLAAALFPDSCPD